MTTTPTISRQPAMADEGPYGQLRPAEVATRGKATPVFDDTTVATTLERVEATGILELLATWRAEDKGPDLGPGGRPAFMTDTPILVGLLLLARDQKPLLVSDLTRLFLHQLSNTARDLLGLPHPHQAFELAHATYDRWYNNTLRAFRRLVAVMDPFPVERWKSKPYGAIADILALHDDDREKTCRARLNEFTRRFLVMTFNLQSRKLRRASLTADITFDQTFLASPTVKGFSHKNLDAKVAEEHATDPTRRRPGPVDPYVGWYVVTGDRADLPRAQLGQADPANISRSNETYKWGFAANIAARVDTSGTARGRFPQLALAATVSLPNVEVAEEAVTLMKATLTTGLGPGVADADMQYFANSLPERLHKPARELGFTFTTDIRKGRTGPRGGNHGARYMEGHAYCPATPTPLLNATPDRKDGIIDIATFNERKRQQKAFRLHVKEHRPDRGKTVMRCPASGPSPTVTCPIRELAKNAARKPRPGVDDDLVPDLPDKICSQHSVTFDDDDFIRDEQAFEWGTPEWETFHQHARNSIESLNAQAKDDGHESLEIASRRRARGFAAGQVLVTILLTNYNIRKLAAFHDDEKRADAQTQNHGPALPRRRDREFYNPYTGTYPFTLTGGERPPGTSPPRQHGNGTGGPPLAT